MEMRMQMQMPGHVSPTTWAIPELPIPANAKAEKCAGSCRIFGLRFWPERGGAEGILSTLIFPPD